MIGDVNAYNIVFYYHILLVLTLSSKGIAIDAPSILMNSNVFENQFVKIFLKKSRNGEKSKK